MAKPPGYELTDIDNRALLKLLCEQNPKSLSHLAELSKRDVFGVLHPLIEQMGREINPATELAKRIKARNAFVTRVLQQPKLWVIGDEHDLGAR